MGTYKSNNNIKSFRDLKCWQAGREARLFVSDLLRTFPSDEKYALVTQMRNASQSNTANETLGPYGLSEEPLLTIHE